MDWRANQLADALAKSAAGDDATRAAAFRQITVAQLALTHHAVVLGMTTHAANNHEITDMIGGGATVTKLVRDSSAEQMQPFRKAKKHALDEEVLSPSCACIEVQRQIRLQNG